MGRLDPQSTARPSEHGADERPMCAPSGARTHSHSGSRLLCAVLCAAAPLSAATSRDPGDIVGVLEVVVPAQESFTLRATMPVPKSTFRGGGVLPLSVVGSGRVPVPTQIEVVSRYPGDEWGADVIEILAQVERPDGLATGERARFFVIEDPHGRGDFLPTPDVQSLLAVPQSLVLRTRDVFGNEYTADLWRDVRDGSPEARVLRDGSIARQVATHEILLPVETVSGGSGTMPHMMGVHAYVTQWAGEDFVSLDLHVHNGMSGHDKVIEIDDALNSIYWDSLDLEVPEGWRVEQAYPSPTLGAGVDGAGRHVRSLVAAQAGGKLHVMPRQSQFWRRLVVYKNGSHSRALTALQERGLAFCRDGRRRDGTRFYSWFNPRTARYFPQNERLPHLEHLDLDFLRGRLAGEFLQFSGIVETGESMDTFPIYNPVMGWAHPWGTRYGGMTGATEIEVVDGVMAAGSAEPLGYRLAQVVARMYVDRQPTALYNKDGRPTTVADWLVHGPSFDYVPMIFFLTPILPASDPFGFGDAPTFQTIAVERDRRGPDYETELGYYQPIDLQHYVRYTRNLKVLAWLGNDALAKDELRMAAELFRLSYHEYYNSPGGYLQGSGMLAGLLYVGSYPGWGLPTGRGNAWGMDAALAAYALGADELRTRYFPWFQSMAQLVTAGQSTCTGVIMSSPSNRTAEGQFRIMQSFSTAFLENAYYGMRTTVFEGTDPGSKGDLEDVLRASTYANVSPLLWRHAPAGPVNWLAMGPYALQRPPYCGPPPPGGEDVGVDGTHTWASLAYGFKLTRDGVFLERAAEMAGGDLYDSLHSTWHNLNNRAAVLALVQELNGE